MKVYQVTVSGGEWEDYYNYVAGSFLKKEKAQELLDELVKNRDVDKEQYLKCQECVLSCYVVDEADYEETMVNCSISKIEQDEDTKDYCCMSEAQCYRDELYEVYEIKEIEVIE